MATDLSSLKLPALIEQMQSDLAVVRLRVLDSGPLSPGVRADAAEHVQVLVATLGNLKRTLRRGEEGDHGRL